MKKTSHPRNMLRWIFQRGNQVLTCQLTRLSNRRSFVLSLIPHGNRGLGGTETFESGLVALQRHATIASSLRESGWKVVAYSALSGRAA